MNYNACKCMHTYWCCKYVLQVFKEAKEKGLTLYGNVGSICFRTPCNYECIISQDTLNDMLGVKDEKPATWKHLQSECSGSRRLFDKDDHDIDWQDEMDYYDGYL